MSVRLKHDSLHSTFKGVELSSVIQYRGIPYGRIPRRFALAESIQDLPEQLDCTQFGPRCPQLRIDVGHLLRVPPSHQFLDEPEDEFNCTNLDVIVPKLDSTPHPSKLPVLVWIHGGSQHVTFGSTASGIGDMTTLVTDSVRQQKPIIAVAIQYRLNVFAVGDGTGPANLALRDQALALEWVQKHISGFGGDPDKVTLAGESAGAVYCHAQVLTDAPVRQALLASGTLHLSPPQPSQNVSALRDAVSKQLQTIDSDLDLKNASTSQMVEAIKMSGLQSWFLQLEERFDGWQTKTGSAESIMLSDVQKEAVIWQAGIWATDVSDIVSAFDNAGPHSDKLKKLYHIHPDRPTSCKTGALDFIIDYKFVGPIGRVAELWHAAHKPNYRYLVDELNPWQPSSGAHHAVDLILLFGGFDMGPAYGAQRTGQKMREAWIKFINLEQPWPSSSDSPYAFGPYGVSHALEDWELRSRRRIALTESLDEMDSALLDRVFFGLANRKVSLLN